MSYFTDLKIKHVDNKYIFYPVITLLLIAFLLNYFIDFENTILIVIGLFLLIILATAFHIYREIDQKIKYQDSRFQALLNIHSMVEAELPLPYLTGWAAFPELIAAILNRVKRDRPSTILEIGSGSSTIITSYLLKELGEGRIISLDHDKNYGEITRNELIKRGLENQAEVHFAPLNQIELEGSRFSWYDYSSVNFDDVTIDLIVVDGPPVKTNKLARYPALPLFYDKLSEKAVIIVDDSARYDEKLMVDLWLQKYPEFSREYIDTEKGVTILKRG